MPTWNDRIRQARESKGLSKSELARRVGVSNPTVTDWESGEIKRLDSGNLLSICRELEVSPNWLMLGREPRTVAVAAAGAESRSLELLADLDALPPDVRLAALDLLDGLVGGKIAVEVFVPMARALVSK